MTKSRRRPRLIITLMPFSLMLFSLSSLSSPSFNPNQLSTSTRDIWPIPKLASLIPSFIMHILRRGTICVEGNIGCGKTTFLDFFRQKFQTTGEEELIPGQSIIAEPVEKWRNVDGENLFHYLYKDPARYSLAFQTYVQLTMMKLHMARPRMMERSIYSARYCFVENLYHLNYLSRLEYVILDKWFKHLVLNGHDDDLLVVPKSEQKQKEFAMLSKPTGVNMDMIVYLRCKPQKVMERIRVRSRKEEKDISMDYIQSLHDLHENWLMHSKFPVPAPVLVLDTNCKQGSLIKLYEKATPYLKGDKKLPKSPLEISLSDDEDIEDEASQTIQNGFQQATFKQ